MKKWFGIMLLWGACTSSWAAVPQVVEGLSFERTIALAGDILQLNGVGVRTVPVVQIRGFVAALYVKKPTQSAQELLTELGAKRLVLRPLVDGSSVLVAQALLRGVKRNTTSEEQVAFADRLSDLENRLRRIGDLHAGDRLELDYVPQQGMIFSFNGQPKGVPIKGEDLYQAILKIFIGERVSDKKLRQDLLGGSVSAADTSAVKLPLTALTSSQSASSELMLPNQQPE